MVQFGRHQAFFLEHEQRESDAYVVPYVDAKHSLMEGDPNAFIKEFHSFLDQASADFSQRMQHVWEVVFATLHHHDNNTKNGVKKSSKHRIDDEEEDDEVVRGATPEKALLLFARMTNKHGENEHDYEAKKTQVLELFKSLHDVASLNMEALRKLVKKYDKKHKSSMTAHANNSAKENSSIVMMNGSRNGHNNHPNNTGSSHHHSLSCRLLPQVYAANFVVGLSAIIQAIELLRFEMGLGSNFTTPAASPTSPSTRSTGKPPLSPTNAKVNATNNIEYAATSTGKQTMSQPQEAPIEPAFPSLDVRRDSHAEHTETVQRRKAEWLWLRQTCQTLDQKGLLPHAVAHRGFHNPEDRSDLRPIENSLQAYETAWTCGIRLCECDIALTKDEQLVLAHDEDFKRLALDDDNPKSHMHVRDLTLAEILSVALKSGSRPPLLADVLQSACTIGASHAQLVIEIKPGNRQAASALARLWAQQPNLMTACAVVMSFDAFCMQSLREELDLIFGSDGEHGDTTLPALRKAYSMGMFPSVAAASLGQHHPSQTSMDTSQQPRYRRPKLLLLTVCDQPKRDVELYIDILKAADRAKLAGWIKGLDGVYLQFQPEMVLPEGLDALRKLARRYQVGVWGHNGRDPDDVHTLEQLVDEGQVTFVNTDLPRCFFDPHSGCGMNGNTKI